MATFWERATGLGAPAFDLQVFDTTLTLHAAGLVPASVVSEQAGLDEEQTADLGELLALMPVADNDRTTWRARVVNVFAGARLGLVELSTVELVQAALGIDEEGP